MVIKDAEEQTDCWTEERCGRITEAIQDLFGAVSRLDAEFSDHGKRFTLDGILVGHLGEVLAAYIFDLELLRSSTMGHDAKVRSGEKLVQIKMTMGKRGVALRNRPDHLIVLQLHDGILSVTYNGEGNLVWDEVAHKPMPSNGQQRVALSRLRVLNKQAKCKLPVMREVPIFRAEQGRVSTRSSQLSTVAE
jgi:hypothetical protein